MKQLIPSPEITPELAARLREHDITPLVEVVLAKAEPWWRRRACAAALLGRVPETSVAGMMERVSDPEDVMEVRRQILEAIATPGRAHSKQLLGWLRGLKPGQPYDFDVAVLKARAALRDVSVFPALSELAADAWTHRRQAAEAAIDALIHVVGSNAMLNEFGAPTLEALAFQQQRSLAARLLGVRLVHRAGGDVTAALGDSSVIVAQHAATLLSSANHGAEALWDRVHKRAPGHLWALVVLHRHGVDIRAEWEALGSPRIELTGVPQDVREAIVRHYSPGQRETDPRWILEAALLGPATEPTDEEEAAHVGRAETTLREAGLKPEKPRHAGEVRHQGGGTFYEIETAVSTVTVSTLGSFFAATGPAVKVLQDAGWRLIDERLGGIEFEKLHVYFFGRRDPLPVQDLLFYWQD